MLLCDHIVRSNLALRAPDFSLNDTPPSLVRLTKRRFSDRGGGEGVLYNILMDNKWTTG